MYRQIYFVVCLLYKQMLRPLIQKAVNDPNEEWDDLVLDMLDGLFGFIKPMGSYDESGG